MVMPIRIAQGWSRDDGDAVSLGIRYFTRMGWMPKPLAPWSHTFLVFEFADGTRLIHEALLSEGWSRKDYAKLVTWLAKNPSRHHAEVHWLPIPPEVVAEMYRKSCGWLGIRSYAWKQIVSLMRTNCVLGRLKRWAIRSDSLELICSEGTSRILAMADGWDLRKSPEDSFDGVSPQDTYIGTMRKLYGEQAALTGAGPIGV